MEHSSIQLRSKLLFFQLVLSINEAICWNQINNSILIKGMRCTCVSSHVSTTIKREKFCNLANVQVERHRHKIWQARKKTKKYSRTQNLQRMKFNFKPELHTLKARAREILRVFVSVPRCVVAFYNARLIMNPFSLVLFLHYDSNQLYRDSA